MTYVTSTLARTEDKLAAPEVGRVDATREQFQLAARCYLLPFLTPCSPPPLGWPFSSDQWQPTTVQQNLLRALEYVNEALVMSQSDSPVVRKSIQSDGNLPLRVYDW